MMTFQWLDATGKKEPLRAKAGVYSNPQLSPDGKRLAMQVTEGSSADIWVYDQQRDAMTRLTSGGGRLTSLRSGARMADTSSSAPSATGSSGPAPTAPASRSRITQIKGMHLPSSITPDGKWLAFFEIPPQIWTVPLEEPTDK